MNITLYTNTSDDNVVDKQLTSLYTTTCELKKETSILSPELLLTGIDSYVGNCNYVYVQELNRYYYVDDIISVNNGLWNLLCHVDVLMSYRDSIRQQTAIVARQENVSNMYLSDPRLKVQANPYVQQLYFSNGFNTTWNYVLTVLGN